jgi:hypothetical protein
MPCAIRFWDGMGPTRAPIFVLYMEFLLPAEIADRIFQLARVSDLAYTQWERAPVSVQIFQPNGDVTRFRVGDFIGTLHPAACFRIDAFRGDAAMYGPTCFEYTVFDTRTGAIVEHAFSMKMGTKRHIVCYPCGIMTYGNHFTNEEWSALVLVPALVTQRID